MRIKAEQVKAGDVVKDRGAVAKVYRWSEFVDITWEGGGKDTFHGSAVLTVGGSTLPTEELVKAAMEDASLDGADADFSNAEPEFIGADEKSHADLIAKLDDIIFDVERPAIVRQVAGDVLGLLADGNPMGRVRYAMGQQAGAETLNGIVEVRTLLQEAGF